MLTLEEIQGYGQEYTVAPLVMEMYGDIITPIALLKKLKAKSKQVYLLESVEKGTQWSRYSFLGYEPRLQITCKNHQITLKNEDGTVEHRSGGYDGIRHVMEQYKSPRVDGLPSFTGGLVGYFAYEMIQYAEPKLKIKESPLDDYNLMLFDKVIVYDHLRMKILLISNTKLAAGKEGYDRTCAQLAEMRQLILEGESFQEEIQPAPQFQCNMTKDRYAELVERTRAYIREGDIFQGVISRRFEATYQGSLLPVYRVLRTTNPSPYMYYIQDGDLEIAGASPETMVKLENQTLTTFPVAGTRPRGKTEQEDKELERELLADPKECSEHNMLVDLGRNDVGRIAEYGSVEVKKYMEIHRFSKVMHIASTVQGQIRPGLDGLHAVEALLPAGTLSGAPKFRACQIINELEPVARGVYGGAIGYLDFSGNLDVCIGIRTAVKKGDQVYVQAGGGIVADSIPDNEYQECANKAGAVIEAFAKAGEVDL